MNYINHPRYPGITTTHAIDMHTGPHTAKVISIGSYTDRQNVASTGIPPKQILHTLKPK